MFYFAVAMELIKQHPLLGPVLLHGIDILYQEIHALDTACVSRLTVWMAHYLNHYSQ